MMNPQYLLNIASIYDRQMKEIEQTHQVLTREANTAITAAHEKALAIAKSVIDRETLRTKEEARELYEARLTEHIRNVTRKDDTEE